MNTGIEIVPPSRAPSDGGQAFFHVTPALGQKLDLLHHLLETSDRVPLIEGPDGIGKSRLLQQLVVTAAPHWRLCAVEANPMLQPDQLLSTLARCFEVETVGSELEQRLLARFDELQQEGWLPVVSIDDAQLLPLESLALLLRLHAARADVARPFGLVLAATPAVHELLQALPGVGDQALQVMELVPMPVEQVKRMVAMFLRRQGSPALSDHRLQRLALESGGLPGEALKRAAATCARGTGARSDPEEKAELRLPSVLSWPMLLGAGLLVTVITLLLVFQDAINALFIGAPAPQGEMLQLPPRERVIPLQRDSAPAVAHVSPGESPPAGAAAPSSSAALATPATPPQDPGSRHQTAPAPPAVPAGEAPPGESPGQSPGTPGSAPPAAPHAPPPVTPGSARPAVPHAPPPVTPGSARPAVPHTPPPVTPGSARPATPHTPPAATASKNPGPHAAARAAAKPPAKTQERRPPAPAGATGRKGVDRPAPPAAAAVPKKAAAIRSRSWLQAQRPGDYTLQLIAVRDEKAARAFIRRSGLRGDIAYFRTLRKGRPWFAVVYGRFPDRKAALAARRRLPPAVAKGKPWPRSFASVQQALRTD